MIKKYGVSLLVVVFAISIAAFTTPAKITHVRPATYFFKYTGSPGSEQDKTLWQNISSGFPTCGNPNDGCLIEVKDTYTTLSNGVRVLTQNVPVVISGTHKNPDVSSDMIEAASNKNP